MRRQRILPQQRERVLMRHRVENTFDLTSVGAIDVRDEYRIPWRHDSHPLGRVTAPSEICELSPEKPPLLMLAAAVVAFGTVPKHTASDLCHPEIERTIAVRYKHHEPSVGWTAHHSGTLSETS